MELGVGRHGMKEDQVSHQPCVRENGMIGSHGSMQNIFQFNMAPKHLYNKYFTMSQRGIYHQGGRQSSLRKVGYISIMC